MSGPLAWIAIIFLHIGSDSAFAQYASAVPDEQFPFGGTLLNAALNYVLRPDSSTAQNKLHGNLDSSAYYKGDIVSALPISSIRSGCLHYLACEFPIPSVEIENAIFYEGTLYLNNLDNSSIKELGVIHNFYASRKGYLPSNQVQYGPGIHWLHGPKISFYNSNDPLSYPNGVKFECLNMWNTSAYFLHPWEAGNAFHSLNDNVFSILASIILQHTKISGTPQTSTQTMIKKASGYKTLFLFNRMADNRNKKLTHIFNTLLWLFEGDIRPAKILLQGVPFNNILGSRNFPFVLCDISVFL